MENRLDSLKDGFGVGEVMHMLMELTEKCEEELELIKKVGTKEKFRLAEKSIKQRNSKMTSIMKSEYPLMSSFDITGGMRFPSYYLEGEPDRLRQYFLSGAYTRNGAETIYSRGQAYYFRYPGIDLKKRLNKKGFEVEGFDSKTYFLSMKAHLKEIDELLGNYTVRKVSDLTEKDRVIILALLEHKKNIIAFLINITNILSDKNYLSDNINTRLIFSPQEGTSLKDRNKDGYSSYRSAADAFNKNKLLEHYHSTERSYLSLLLGKKIDGEHMDLHPNGIELDEDGQNRLQKIVGAPVASRADEGRLCLDDSFVLIERYFDFFDEALIGMRESNKQVFIKKSISKLVRHQREEDNPWNMLLSSLLIVKKLIAEKRFDQPIEIYGILYGGMEFPFVLKYLIEEFKSKNSHMTDILLYNFSLYDLKNAYDRTEKDDYPFSQSQVRKFQKKTKLKMASILDDTAYDDESIENCLSIILDDNIHSGETIFKYLDLVKSNNKFPVVSSMFLDRDQMRYDGGSDSESGSFDEMLTSQISLISSRLPIDKHGKEYKNTVNTKIERIING